MSTKSVASRRNRIDVPVNDVGIGNSKPFPENRPERCVPTQTAPGGAPGVRVGTLRIPTRDAAYGGADPGVCPFALPGAPGR